MSVATATIDAPNREEIREIVHGILRTLRGDLHAQHVELHAELADLSKLIHDTRAEIARARVADIRDYSLPNANDELDAVVEATEHATHSIMSAVEQIEAVAGELDEEPSGRIRTNVTAIYEACSFQDITGQRVRKVVKTMQEIDAKVAALIVMFGAANDGGSEAPPRGGDVLEGPQRAGEGVSQADIDALFSS